MVTSSLPYYCRDLVLFVGRLLAQWPLVLRVCLRRDVVWWWFSSWWCLRFCLGQCVAGYWKFFFNYFQYQEVVGCICMLNYWFSSYDEICPENYNYSRFKLKDKCRSEKWELYLYGVMIIKVVLHRCSSLSVVTCLLLWRHGMGS